MAYTGTGTATNVETANAAGTLPSFQAAATFTTGSWTPTLKFGGATTGITYGIQQGYYTQIGNLIFIYALISLTSKGTAVGVVTVDGLPQAVSAQANYNPVGQASHYINITIAGFTWLNLQFLSGTTTFSIEAMDTTSTSPMGDANFTNTSGMYFMGFYQV